MADSFHMRAVDCAGRAADRAAAILHRELGRGSTSLQAIACIAPLLGMFGAAVLLIDALRYDMPGFPPCGDCAGGASEALVPIALGLPVAILARGGFHYLSHQVETFDLEMRAATLDLLNSLKKPAGFRSANVLHII